MYKLCKLKKLYFHEQVIHVASFNKQVPTCAVIYMITFDKDEKQ